VVYLVEIRQFVRNNINNSLKESKIEEWREYRQKEARIEAKKKKVRYEKRRRGRRGRGEYK
jgi:hypothetical protein